MIGDDRPDQTVLTGVDGELPLSSHAAATDTAQETSEFREDSKDTFARGDLVLSLDGYEGPIDVLLNLARDQKVDLVHISILDLAEQYLKFVEVARHQRLELAADYLVMAAWLAYLKSRLLLPREDEEDGPTGEELAAALTFRLRQLEAMQDAGQKLMTRPRLGRDVFSRGQPEGIRVINHPIYQLSLYDLLRAYGDQTRRRDPGTLHFDSGDLTSMDEAIQRLNRVLPGLAEWTSLSRLMAGAGGKSPLGVRSAMASSFAASLELVRNGKAEIRQDRQFGDIYLRARSEPT